MMITHGYDATTVVMTHGSLVRRPGMTRRRRRHVHGHARRWQHRAHRPHDAARPGTSALPPPHLALAVLCARPSSGRCPDLQRSPRNPRFCAVHSLPVLMEVSLPASAVAKPGAVCALLFRFPDPCAGCALRQAIIGPLSRPVLQRSPRNPRSVLCVVCLLGVQPALRAAAAKPCAVCV